MNEELARKEQNGYVEAPDEDDLFPQSAESKFKTHQYELFGMIVHHGYSTSRGHYYALIKVTNVHSAQPGKWAKFDDEKVSLIDQSQISSYSQKAYLLFY